jgi:hypothetical protein
MPTSLTTTRNNPACRRGPWIAIFAAAAAGAVLPLLPAAWALRGRGPVVVDGIGSLDDAVADCQRTGLIGWDRVTYAQRLVYRQFRTYSCRNLWDTPVQAFRRGMGYCTQYNLALQQLLDRLGCDTQAVFALRVAVVDNPAWTMGHTWLRVRVDSETRDVCAGHADNVPGRVNFTPLLPVLPGNGFVLFLTHLGLIGYAGLLEWRALLTRQPVPDWMFQARPPMVAADIDFIETQRGERQ